MPSDRTVLSDEVYRRLRDQLIQGEIEPGERLTETSLAERFEVSRTPIRDAIRRLEGEHLIDRRGGAMHAASFDLAGAVELLTMRKLLEPHCAELSAPHLTRVELARIGALATEMEAVSESLPHAELNNEFHTLLCSRCPLPRLLGEVDRLRDHLVTYRLYVAYEEGDLDASNEGHRRIAEAAAAVAGGEAEAAELGRLLGEHLELAIEALRRDGAAAVGASGNGLVRQDLR